LRLAVGAEIDGGGFGEGRGGEQGCRDCDNERRTSGGWQKLTAPHAAAEA
jgi:hypothetical protein